MLRVITIINLFVLFSTCDLLVNCFVKFMNCLFSTFIVVTFASFLNLKAKNTADIRGAYIVESELFESRKNRGARVQLGNSSGVSSSTMSRKFPRQLRGNVFRNSWTMSKKFFRSNQPVCRSCNRPVKVVYRNTLIPVWFGHFCLATIWTTCLNQFLDNVEEIS